MSTYVRNGRGSAHSRIPFSTWQRHTVQCVERGHVTKNTGKPCEDGCRGSKHTREMRLHALRATVTLTGALVDDRGRQHALQSLTGDHAHDASTLRFRCPTCRHLTRIVEGHADRLISGANGGRYDDVNVMMICGPCNESKGDSNAPAALIQHAAKLAGKALIGKRVPAGLMAIVTAPTKGKRDSD